MKIDCLSNQTGRNLLPIMSDFTNNLRLCFDLITACGISSTCPGHSAETASRWKLWIWFSIALHFSIILVTVHCREFYLRSDLSAVGMLLNIMYYCALGISAGIVILQALLTQNRQNEFLEKMTQLRSLRVKDEEKDNQFSARLAKLFIISFCVIILSNVLFFLMISYDAQWTQYYFASTLPTTINRIVCMKVFIFLEILYRELNSFRECISGFVQNGSGLKDIHIHLLSDWHSEIIDAVAMFKSLFHWSLMVVLWDGYLLLGSNMYWAYLQIMIRKNYWASLSRSSDEIELTSNYKKYFF